MKKITILTVLSLCFVFVGFCSTSFAYNVYASGEITIGGNDADSTDITIGLSPKVVAKYENPGTTDATAQWFAIATAHPGGNMIYGTAQNLNNIYSKEFTTGTALSATVLDIPTNANSASDWSDNGWDM